jgi:universal stress protein A
MKGYKCILLAVDLHPNCDNAAVQRAIDIARDSNAKLYVVHAVEHVNAYGVAQAYPTVLNLEDEMVESARGELSKFGKNWGVSDDHLLIEVGSPKVVILDQVSKLHADLIVVGSHGRHGISLLLGSTANTVLHHAPCDVLAVRVHDKH